MAKTTKENKIRNVTITYAGTENDINIFLKTIIKDYLIEHKFIYNQQRSFIENVA